MTTEGPMGDAAMSNEQSNRLKGKIVAEGRKLLWIFVYLWAVLGLFAIHKSIVLNEQNLIYHQGFALTTPRFRGP
jgi:hypothetical protein